MSDWGQALGAFVFTHDVIEENQPHAHHDYMKIAYVLEGEYDFRVGDASLRWENSGRRPQPSSSRT